MTGTSISKLVEVQAVWEVVETHLGRLAPAMVDLDWVYHADRRRFPVFKASFDGFDLSLNRMAGVDSDLWTARVEGESMGPRGVSLEKAVENLVSGFRKCLELSIEHASELLHKMGGEYTRAVCEICHEPATSAVQDHPRCDRHTYPNATEDGLHAVDEQNTSDAPPPYPLLHDADGLIKVGYWRGRTDPNLPEPVSTEYLPAIKAEILSWLRNHTEVLQRYKGFSRCRFCDTANGSVCYTDGTYRWPEGLYHYVAEHDVELPESFVLHMGVRPRMRNFLEDGFVFAPYVPLDSVARRQDILARTLGPKTEPAGHLFYQEWKEGVITWTVRNLLDRLRTERVEAADLGPGDIIATDRGPFGVASVEFDDGLITVYDDDNISISYPIAHRVKIVKRSSTTKAP